ncbi:apoptosis-associated speck-like protein containing a CARD [Centroberyx affinis]|uniref:apoptosis-associated speck-like protein containing a CARD n=1 Tax=Centroberyx affinis TaxID=166261 RepID=UPI003A5BB994
MENQNTTGQAAATTQCEQTVGDAGKNLREAGSRTTTAQTGGVVNAPDFTGARFEGANINFNINTPNVQEETDAVSPKDKGKHFVDKHREELTKRVNKVSPILDTLLAKDVIDQESYDNIRSKPTTQEQMRELYKSLNASGDKGKDIFKNILEKQEKFLMDDLKKNH